MQYKCSRLVTQTHGTKQSPLKACKVAQDEDFVRLPSRLDIQEHEIIKQFCRTVDDDAMQQDLRELPVVAPMRTPPPGNSPTPPRLRVGTGSVPATPTCVLSTNKMN